MSVTYFDWTGDALHQKDYILQENTPRVQSYWEFIFMRFPLERSHLCFRGLTNSIVIMFLTIMCCNRIQASKMSKHVNVFPSELTHICILIVFVYTWNYIMMNFKQYLEFVCVKILKNHLLCSMERTARVWPDMRES